MEVLIRIMQITVHWIVTNAEYMGIGVEYGNACVFTTVLELTTIDNCFNIIFEVVIPKMLF